MNLKIKFEYKGIPVSFLPSLIPLQPFTNKNKDNKWMGWEEKGIRYEPQNSPTIPTIYHQPHLTLQILHKFFSVTSTLQIPNPCLLGAKDSITLGYLKFDTCWKTLNWQRLEYISRLSPSQIRWMSFPLGTFPTQVGLQKINITYGVFKQKTKRNLSE